ncbi:MAG: 2'-5' RNA ligase family protein [Bacillota bacterium]
MRSILWGLLSLVLVSCATHKVPYVKSLNYTDQIFTPVPFVAHTEPGPFKSYLTMSLSYPGFESLLREVEKSTGTTLKNRGEAHITVITPPEFDTALSKKISMKEINTLAEKLRIQGTPFKPLCVGKGVATLHGAEQTTYFVVIESESLFKLRKAIQDLYIAKGGQAADFNPDLFFPHVTLGYTERDLHFEDGIKKDVSKCFINLEPGPRKK